MDVSIVLDTQSNIRFGVATSYCAMTRYDTKRLDNVFTPHTEYQTFTQKAGYPELVKGIFKFIDNREDKISYTDYSARGPIIAGGGGYPVVGNQMKVTKSSFQLAIEYAKKGFFGIGIDNQGNRVIVPWLYLKTPVAKFTSVPQIGFRTMVRGSFNSLDSTPYSKLYTHVELKCNEDQFGNAQSRLKIDKTEEASFPLDSEWTIEGATNNVDLVAGYVYFLVNFGSTLPSGWTLGTIVTTTLSGFDALLIIKTHDPISGIAKLYYYDGAANYATTHLAVDLTEVSGVKTWQTYFATDVDIGYAEAKEIWEAFHTAYLRRGGKQMLSSVLSNVDELNTDDPSNLVSYLKNIINWDTFTKQIGSFSVSVPDGLDLNLMDCIAIRDVHLTLDIERIGWIYELALDASSGVFDIKFILDIDPNDPYVGIGDIDEGVDIADPNTFDVDYDEKFDNGTGGLPVDDIDEA
jgi:hypothetical protein